MLPGYFENCVVRELEVTFSHTSTMAVFRTCVYIHTYIEGEILVSKIWLYVTVNGMLIHSEVVNSDWKERTAQDTVAGAYNCPCPLPCYLLYNYRVGI